ncbi:putative baseplate assembly protein [Tumebacillus permanentifrigoris]|uniref:Putative phage baseplate assembly protein n=1 Tax=Tumebacillus permanentifrigoris TaxID=378543 RepID=A0A316DU33_9BACL|nr:putative baseplate assembly protein [Tumebacillus permanentifrigoris]PWK11533.1 putative phage baseplate assembly protein [Tumebacillus permanentifrigoris]
MLPMPNLDDRLFAEIVDDARKNIPSLLPQWTDENAHDPGITMIELFSWLTEMQQYYLNRVTAKNERKFLQLLGLTLRPATSAQVDVTFGGLEQAQRLPRGLKLQALDETFETTEALWAFPHRIQRVLVKSNAESSDYTSANENGRVGFYAFGAEAQRQTSLCLGFDQPLPPEQFFTLTINLREEHAIVRNPAQEGLEVTPSARVAWSYYGSDGTWHPLKEPNVQDGTNQFSQTGRVTIKLPGEMGRTTIHPASDIERAWIACEVVETGYEVPPMVEKCTLNTALAVHGDTHSLVRAYESDGSAHQTLESDDYLAWFGHVDVQVLEPGGNWRDWKKVDALAACAPRDNCYELVRNPEHKTTRITFGDARNGRIPPRGQGTIRLICYAEDFKSHRLLGKSDGLPNQRFSLPMSPLLPDSLMVQVGIPVPGTDGKQWEWQDWTRVDDLERSRSDDCHYLVDLDEEEILFGDHEYGQIPHKMAESVPDFNIRLISYRTGGGERGNVQKDRISGVIAPAHAFAPTLSVTNHVYAAGGRERESLTEAKGRLRQEMRHATRAVTADDYEQIARATPGLRVARVKAIPLYRVGQEDEQEHLPGQVTVVVVPFSDSAKPMPSTGFLQTVQRHLNQHRLLTTEVHVVAPEYVQITVNAVVVVHPDYRHQTERVLAALGNLLDVLDDRDPTKGWEFGRAVYKGDVYEVINRLPGVEYIQSLWLDAEGRGIRRDSNGDIHLPPHGLVYSGAHTVQLLSRTDL